MVATVTIIVSNKLKILILGGGFAGVSTFFELRRLFRDGEVDIKILDKTGKFVFTPWLVELAVGNLAEDSVSIKLGDLVAKETEIVRAEVNKIDFKQKEVRVKSGGENKNFSYDYLVVAVGAKSYDGGVKGVEKWALNFKTINEAKKIRDKCLGEKVNSGVIIGGGPTGVELASSLKEVLGEKSEIYLIQRDKNLLSNLSKESQDKALFVLNKKGVKVKLGVAVEEVMKTSVKLVDGREIKSDMTIWTGGVKSLGQLILGDDFLCDNLGRVKVSLGLNLSGNKDVFVVGDAAEVLLNNKPVPMLAQVAVKAGQVVARNIFYRIK